jgi:hypothetical protein
MSSVLLLGQPVARLAAGVDATGLTCCRSQCALFHASFMYAACQPVKLYCSVIISVSVRM